MVSDIVIFVKVEISDPGTGGTCMKLKFSTLGTCTDKE
jgi:hypothetical protein